MHLPNLTGGIQGWHWQSPWLHSVNQILSGRVAHACDDGEIRAPWVEFYWRKDHIFSIYGKCRKCNTPLSDGIKAIILLEYVV